MLSREWRCSWSSADRLCSNYIWVISNFIAHKGATCIRSLSIYIRICLTHGFNQKRSCHQKFAYLLCTLAERVVNDNRMFGISDPSSVFAGPRMDEDDVHYLQNQPRNLFLPWCDEKVGVDLVVCMVIAKFSPINQCGTRLKQKI